MLGLSARASLRWLDGLLVLDHASDDATPAIIHQVRNEHPGAVWSITDDAAQWNEATQRARMHAECRARGATHVAILDADEVLSANLVGRIRQIAAAMPSGCLLWLPWICCWRSRGRFRANGVWGDARAPVLLADAEQCRWEAGAGDYQFHRRAPVNATRLDMLSHGIGGLMHLQFVDRRRLAAKQALYKMQEVIRWPEFKDLATLNQQYGQAMDEADMDLRAVPVEWWEPYRDLLSHLHVGEAPWQEAECRRLWIEHGAERFAGLDLFGVVS